MNHKYFLSPLLFFLAFTLYSQDKMEVIRTSAVDRSTPISNVYIDEDNQKWVGNRNGLFEVFSPEQGSKVELPASEWSLLQTHDGNRDLRFPLESLLLQMGNDGQALRAGDDRISTAVFDPNREELWVGTRRSGLFQFKVSPALSLIKHHHSGNSKLNSDRINTLFVDTEGTLWIGTDEGTAYGKNGKWQLEEKYFSFRAFAQNGTDVWAMADNLLWKINARGSWIPVDIEQELVEGVVADIAFDNNGMLWIASEIVSRFDPATREYAIFGPAQEFTSQDVFCIAVDQDNVVWIGTSDKGLYIIQKASTLYVAVDIKKDLTCGSATHDAALGAVVTGGEGPYTYKWNKDISGADPGNLGPGEYVVTITDSKGKSNSARAVITDPNLDVTVKQGKQASPDGSDDGTATVSVSGGKPGYTYQWDNGEKSATAFKLSEGEHTVTVTDKAGCSATAKVDIGREVGALAVELSMTSGITCPGEKSGGIEATPKGGKGPYDYTWNISTVQGPTATNLPSGNYTVTLSDAAGQNATASITIEEPAPLVLNVMADKPASTGNKDGQATAKASGGNGGFSFKWDNGETTPAATGLGPGAHTVTVTDQQGCTASATVDISENILPLSVTVSQSSGIKCAGSSDAGLAAEASGGKGPYQYTWSRGDGQGNSTNNLSAGTVGVTLTDATGASAVAEYTITEPKAIEVSVTPKSPASTGNADGRAQVKARGGTGDYSYNWDNGETSATAEKLPPGIHEVTVTDEAGCTAVATVTITENILPLSVEINQDNAITCAGTNSAAISANVSGGKPPFSFEWTGTNAATPEVNSLTAGDYSVVVKDAAGNTASDKITIGEPKMLEVAASVQSPASTGNADGIATAKASGGTGKLRYSWDNGEMNETARALAPGGHSVTVTDESGCVAEATVNIPENILPLTVSISQTEEIKCTGGTGASLNATVKGGKGPFQYTWTGTANTSGRAEGLSAGQYNVVVTDATGTTASAQATIKEPAALTADMTVDSPASTGNADGKATIHARGGTGEYSYSWDNGETGRSASRLAPGGHVATITDGAGCTATASATITENILPLTVQLTETQKILCQGDQSASLQAAVKGGKGPFSYTWNQDVTGAEPGNLPAGNYTLTVTDAMNSTATASLIIGEPDPVEVTITKTRPATTESHSNGKAFLQVEGGVGTYTYNWDNGETGSQATELSPGIHRVTVSDDNGCKAEAEFEIKTRIIPELTAETLRGGEIIKLQKIFFQPDSTDMDPSSIPTVDELYEFLEENPGIVIEVGGHTNGIPSHEFCDALSTARAKSVAQYLVDKGISAKRITYKGYGKRNPIATNQTPEGRAKNQRVEIKIVRLEGDG